MQVVLLCVLYRFEARYTAVLPILDELLTRHAPTNEDLTKLKNQVPNNLVILDYFYSRLSSPQWLLPLKRERFFRYPPGLIIDEDQGTVRLPPWPASRYLVRMAE